MGTPSGAEVFSDPLRMLLAALLSLLFCVQILLHRCSVCASGGQALQRHPRGQ